MTSPTAYVDFSSLAQLRYDATQAPQSSLRQVAGQFESLFAHMLLKSMRATSLGDGLFDSKESDFYRDMLDQQMSVELTKGRGLGLAEMLVKQLQDFVQPEKPEVASSGAIAKSQSDFVETVMPFAKRAARLLGVPPAAIVSQAALETGWGQRVIENTKGQSSHNLFGIKADSSWKGEKIAVRTLEVVDGSAQRVLEPFRAYETLQQGFDDYVEFLRSNPRYGNALKQTDSESFINEIHKAGYATDPKYSDKIIQILKGDSLKQAIDGSGIKGFFRPAVTVTNEG